MRPSSFALPLAALAGAALGAAALGGALARRTKPLHPEGVAGTGTLTVEPGHPSSVALLDTAGAHPCELRWSRATGLPARWPDVEGLAVRVCGADVLLASTGTGDISRYVLAVRALHRHGDLTTLLPVRSPGGPLVLRLAPAGTASPPRRYTLSWSRARGPWHPCGRLEVEWAPDDATTRFHPVGRPLPGTRQYSLVTALRAPAYAVARLVTARARPVAQ